MDSIHQIDQSIASGFRYLRKESGFDETGLEESGFEESTNDQGLLMIDNDYDADLQEDGSRDSNRAVCTCRKSFQLLSPCSRTALLN